MVRPDGAALKVEEYDKLDCAARGMWRQLLQHPERANISSTRWVCLIGRGWQGRGWQVKEVPAAPIPELTAAATRHSYARPAVVGDGWAAFNANSCWQHDTERWRC